MLFIIGKSCSLRKKFAKFRKDYQRNCFAWHWNVGSSDFFTWKNISYAISHQIHPRLEVNCTITFTEIVWHNLWHLIFMIMKERNCLNFFAKLVPNNLVQIFAHNKFKLWESFKFFGCWFDVVFLRQGQQIRGFPWTKASEIQLFVLFSIFKCLSNSNKPRMKNDNLPQIPRNSPYNKIQMILLWFIVKNY